MQGFNMGRYVPPDLEGTVSGNQVQRKRAPGTLRKDGTQTVRFEMPFAVWCHGCKPHEIIGQGVRFNAVKSRVGYYHSTPIWNFVLKHAACGHTIEIRTDPQNTAYVVVSGGKARDYGDAAGGRDTIREGEADVPILTAEERDRRREDAFAAFEGKVQDRTAAQENGQRIQELYRARERDWSDPFTANRRLRKTFRHERKLRQREEQADESLKQRLGTNIDLLPESTQDVQRAKLVSFGSVDDDAVSTTVPKPFLKDMKQTQTQMSSNASKRKENPREGLRRQLIGNTRAAMNPFGGTTRKA